MPCHFAIGILPHGTKEVLGLWIDGWGGPVRRDALRSLKDRGVEDIFYLSGWGERPDVGRSDFPQASFLPHVAELIRRSLRLVATKDALSVKRAIEPLHGAPTTADASKALDTFEASALGRKYPAIAMIWRREWATLRPFLELPREIRKVAACWGAADELRRNYKRALRGHGSVSTTDDASALMYLAARDVQRSWRRPSRDWPGAKLQLATMFIDRFDVD
jgi:putative transposase